MTLEELRAQATKAAEEAKAKVAENLERIKLTTIINSANNTALVDAKVKVLLIEETTIKLKELDFACEHIVASMPILSSKTRENRKWNPSKQYGMGNHIALLTGLLSGIQYSANDHKQQMLAVTGLSEDVIEQTLEAFGSTAYYSVNYSEIVPEVPYNLPKLLDLIAIIEDTLAVVIDKTLLTEKGLSSRFSLALARAEKAEAEDELTEAVNHQTIKVD